MDIEVKTLLIGLLVTLLVTAVVYFVARAVEPRWAGPSAVIVLLVGALLTLVAAL